MRTLVVGVTGSIGMGKSSISRHFAKLGFPVHDADAEVHRLYSSGGAAVAPVAEFGAKFGATVISESGGICRQKLSAVLAADPSRFAALTAIVHPLLAKGRAKFLSDANEANTFCAVLDVPMLFETTNSGESPRATGVAGYDYIVVASTLGDEAIQAKRVLRRDGWTQEKLDMILAKQIPDADKRARADIVVDTRDSHLSAMRSQVASAVQKMAEEHPALFKATVLLKSGAPTYGSSAAARSVLNGTPLSTPGSTRNATHSGSATPSTGAAEDAMPAARLPIKVVALDLDDTIWPLMGWIKGISSVGDTVLQKWMPRAYDAGLRYPLRDAMEKVKQAEPLISHDIGVRRSKALAAIVQESGDSAAAVGKVMEEIERHRTDLAVDAMYDDVIPFLKALRRRGIVVAAITDGTADVMSNAVLSKLFTLSVSASSSGAEKPSLAPFLELLTKVSLSAGRKVFPEEVLVIGDNYGKDCLGALQAGMAGAWLRRPEGEQVALVAGVQPDPRVASITSLTEDALAAAGVVLAAPAAGL